MNDDAFDVWTIVHIVSGFLLAFFKVGRPIAYSLIIAVEIAEFLLRGRSGFFRESRLNIAADLAVGIGAYELKRQLR